MGRRKMPIEHGTSGGYRTHFRHKVPMCEPCRDAERRRLGRRPMRYAPCGTRSAYHRHLRHGESCEACRQANTVGCQAARQVRLARGLPADDPRHGTVGGYTNHGCRCPGCTAANSEKSAARRARMRLGRLS